MMNKSTLLIFNILLLFSACKSPGTFQVEGGFARKDPTPVKLYLLGKTQSVLIDSVYTEGDFSLKGSIDEAGIYLLSFFNDQQIFLVLLPGDKIKLNIDNTFPSISYYVENSFESKRVKELKDSEGMVKRRIHQLSLEWEKHPGDTLRRKEIDSAYMAIILEQREFTRNFIFEYPNSLANILAVYQEFGNNSQALFDTYEDFDLFRFVDSSLVSVYPSSAPVIILNEEINKIKDEIKHKKYIKKIVEAGRPLPLLRYVDIHGDTLSIEEKPGKPVLLLFWASWNEYSTREILAFNEYYKKELNDEILVISISLDSREEELLNFISGNDLTLPVICDYDFLDSELAARYAVKRIPSTLLSNEQGLIIAKDIFGDELYNQINELIR